MNRLNQNSAAVDRQSRILVVRGGAIGDFILTLPALGLLREAFPSAWIELLGYPHIASLADGRYYVNKVRSIEYGPLAGFFAKNAGLNPELAEYFRSFQQVVSFLFDPDGIFEANVRTCGVRNFLSAFRQPSKAHAAREWAKPLESLALYLENHEAKIFLRDTDLNSARDWLADGSMRGVATVEPLRRIALHPGSGSLKKNWPAERWRTLGVRFFEAYPNAELILVGGEADGDVLQILETAWPRGRFRVARDLPLTLLAAILSECDCFCGHDSGVSHIASAVGVRSLLLFGPTDPNLWAPANKATSVLVAPDGSLDRLRIEDVQNALWTALNEVWRS
jgi:heptosyltransferase-2